MSRHTQIACLIILGLIVAVNAKLELPSTMRNRKDNSKDFSKDFVEEIKTDSPNDICSTSLNPGESFSYNVASNPNITSGYLNIGSGNATASSLFFLFYKCRNLNSSVNPNATGDFTSVPVVIWLQGGPGSSSLLGAFYEFGPYTIVKNNATGALEEVAQNSSWNDFYNLLIIENPVGVGFSNLANVSDLTQNETLVAENMLNALLNFYTNVNITNNLTGLLKTPLYIFGESYAGHYIPPICDRILRYNAQTTGSKIPLTGAGVGNGWVDPPNQLSEYGLYGYALGVIDEDERAYVEQAQLDAVYNIQQGRKYISQGNYPLAAPFMNSSLNDFDNLLNKITSAGGNLNVYNYRIFGGYNFDNLASYLNLATTQQLYCTRGSRLGDTTWSSGSDDVYANMSYYDFMDTVASNVSNVLNANLPILFYNGQDDIICNSPSTQTWISKLPWASQQAFYSAPPQVWILNNGTHGGFAKNYGPLTFAVVNKAGHLAPMDQISPTIEMLRRFIGNSKNWTAPYYDSPKAQEKVLVEKLFNENEFLLKNDFN